MIDNAIDFHARYDRGQAYFTLNIDEQSLIVGHRWTDADSPWLTLADDELKYNYAYPAVIVHAWVESLVDPLLAEVINVAFHDRVTSAVRRAQDARGGYLPVTAMADELQQILDDESSLPLI